MSATDWGLFALVALAAAAVFAAVLLVARCARRRGASPAGNGLAPEPEPLWTDVLVEEPASEEPAGEVLADDTCAALSRALRGHRPDDRYSVEVPPLGLPPFVPGMAPTPQEQVAAAVRDAAEASPVLQLHALVAMGRMVDGLDEYERAAHLDQLALLASRTLGREEQAVLGRLIVDLRLVQAVIAL